MAALNLHGETGNGQVGCFCTTLIDLLFILIEPRLNGGEASTVAALAGAVDGLAGLIKSKQIRHGGSGARRGSSVSAKCYVALPQNSQSGALQAPQQRLQSSLI